MSTVCWGTGKNKLTRRKARRQAKQMQRRTGHNVTAYLCQRCRQWHVGTLRGPLFSALTPRPTWRWHTAGRYHSSTADAGSITTVSSVNVTSPFTIQWSVPAEVQVEASWPLTCGGLAGVRVAMEEVESSFTGLPVRTGRILIEGEPELVARFAPLIQGLHGHLKEEAS